MNWREQPRLFANGKFSIEWPATGMKTEIDGFEKYVSTDNKDCFILADGDYLPPERGTLCARPIADMSDAECTALNQCSSIPELELQAKTDDLSAVQLLNLLSIGVYPFSQSHFQTGEVLNINEVTS